MKTKNPPIKMKIEGVFVGIFTMVLIAIFWLVILVKMPITYFDGENIIYVDRWRGEIIKVEPIFHGRIRKL